MDELISRQAAIETAKKMYVACDTNSIDDYEMLMEEALKVLPSAVPDKDKVSDLLYHIYLIESPHLDMSGVIAKKYYYEELWKELFGKESELPGWMT